MNSFLLVCLSLFLFSVSFAQQNTDTYLLDIWTMPPTENTFVFNTDGTFTGVLGANRLIGRYTVDLGKNPYWLDLLLNAGYIIPGVYAHTTTPDGRKGLQMAVPQNNTEIVLGIAKRPEKLDPATALNFIGSFITTSTSTTKSSTSSTTGKSTTTTTGKSTTTTSGKTSTSTTGNPCPPTMSCSDCKDDCKKTCKTAGKNEDECIDECRDLICDVFCSSDDDEDCPPTLSCSDCKKACKKTCKTADDNKDECKSTCKDVTCDIFC